MFKVRVIALYILLSLLALLTVLNIAGNEDEEIRRAEARVKATNAIGTFQAVEERDTLQRGELGRLIAESDVSGYMKTLRNFRVELVALEDDVYEAWPLSDDPQEEVRRAKLRRTFVSEERPELLTRFSDMLTNAVLARTGDMKAREAFREEAKNQLVECGAVGRNQCAHRFTYLPLLKALKDLLPSGARAPLVILVDDRGTGWAMNKNAKWSDKSSFAEEHAIIRRARQEVANDFIRLEDVYYRATATPFVDGDRSNGCVLVGQEVDQSGYAASTAKGLGLEFLLVDKGDIIVASNDDVALHSFAIDLVNSVPEEARRQRVSSGSMTRTKFEGVAFYLTSDAKPSLERQGRGLTIRSEAQRIKAVLVLDLTETLVDLHRVGNYVPLIALLVCLLGIILLLVTVWHYQRPFERIDEGIHEVIGGNQAYEFEFDFREDLADSIAQNLNMMVAILTGRPLPDELADARSQNWAESMLIGKGLDDEHSGAALPAAAPAPSKSTDPSAEGLRIRSRTAQELSKEPAERYYKRLFADYVAIRSRLGADVEGMTYVRFVEKVVKSERALRESLDSRSVRFNAEEKGGQAVLTPVALD